VKVTKTDLEGVLLIEPRRFGDDRGHFAETWNLERYRKHEMPEAFVQDNVSYSKRGVLRGLHLQNPGSQTKLVEVLWGEAFDVVVDVRADSPTFRRWIGYRLSGENGRQLYVPAGYAHGFCVTGASALFAYKCSNYYDPSVEITVRWDDPDLAIAWPVAAPIVSEKDRAAPLLRDVDPRRLPRRAEGRA